jgi:hypothetical protein
MNVPHSCVEWVDVAASHLGLEAMDARGYFVPLALVPLSPFIEAMMRPEMAPVRTVVQLKL